MRVWWPLLLFFCPDALLSFQHPAGETTKPPFVEGRVIDAKSGEAVKKALVILRRGKDRGIGAYSDAAGNFAFQPVEPGLYALSAERDGYIADPGAKPTIVNLKPGDPESSLLLKLLRTGAISGRVLDTDGEPVMGANIQIHAASQKKGPARPGFAATTNDRGEYRAFNLPPDKYRISVSYTRGLHHPNVNIQRATDLSGAVAEEAYAVTYYPGTVSTRDAAIVQIESGTDLAGFDLQLRRMRAVRVRGTVTGPGGAATGFIAISLQPAGGEGQFSQAFVLSPEGRFDLGGVLPGRYLLTADAPMTQKTLAARRVVEVGENGLDGVQLTLAEPQKLNGRILVPEGRKLPSLLVTLSSRERQDHQGGGMAQPTSDGSYTLPNVPPGDYDVALAATGPADDLYIASIRMGDSDVLTGGVHVVGALAELEITLKANGGTLECSVSNSNQEPLPDAQVVLLPDPPRQSQMALYGECRTDATGACTLTGVTPGDYHVFAFASEEERDFRDPESLKEFEKLCKPVKITEGDRHKVELKAVPEQN